MLFSEFTKKDYETFGVFLRKTKNAK
jgi:hypothetical protein